MPKGDTEAILPSGIATAHLSEAVYSLRMTEARLPPTRPDLDTLLDAALKIGGELDAFDFKELLDLRMEEHKVRLLRAIGAFGNTDGGGHLFIGIRDGDRALVGLSDEIADLYDQTPIQVLVNQHFAPAPTIQVR